MISIIVPTYNETENPKRVAAALKGVMGERDFEVLFIDDSTDPESVAALHALAEECVQVRVFQRDSERGLATAVVHGFALARGDLIAVMDADMQHPPELIPAMIDAIEAGADVVIPSRFVPGGGDGGLSPLRKFVSWTARKLGQFFLRRVRAVSDPTSGFFMLRREVVENVQLRPIGWKILIEVLVRGHYDRVAEIPYWFQSRAAGKSNMSLKEQWNYLKHLARLVADSPEDRRVYVFGAVGISGVVINMLVYAGLVRLHLELWQASVIAGAIAMVSNFILNDRLTWNDSRSGLLLKRFLKYILTSLVGIGINAGILSVLAYGLHVHYLLANAFGILIAMVWNFIVNNVWTWKMRNAERRHSIAL